MKVYVVTNPELGWDCVVSVYTADSEEEVEKYLSKLYNIPQEDIQDNYIITEEKVLEIKT